MSDTHQQQHQRQQHDNIPNHQHQQQQHHPFGEGEPVLYLSNGAAVPQLAFGLYKVPATRRRTTVDNSATTSSFTSTNNNLLQQLSSLSGEEIILNAIKVGYRHFDSASIYGNESILGHALKASGRSRKEFFLTTKVWNDVQHTGCPKKIRQSVEQSLKDIVGPLCSGIMEVDDNNQIIQSDNDDEAKNKLSSNCSDTTTKNNTNNDYYLDLCYIHWPVPNQFVNTYLVLQELVKEGTIKAIGISNFSITDYEELISSHSSNFHTTTNNDDNDAAAAAVDNTKKKNDDRITIHPVINQIEVSPFMYRPQIIHYFQHTTQPNMIVAASKALFRAVTIQEEIQVHPIIQEIANKHSTTKEEKDGSTLTIKVITPAQVLLRWSYQKNFIILVKTSNIKRMIENRNIFHFTLTSNEILQLDNLTTEYDIQQRHLLEEQRKCSY